MKAEEKKKIAENVIATINKANNILQEETDEDELEKAGLSEINDEINDAVAALENAKSAYLQLDDLEDDEEEDEEEKDKEEEE